MRRPWLLAGIGLALLAAVVIVVVVFLAGPARPPAPPGSVAAPPPGTAAEAARAVAVAYLQALQSGDYAGAHRLLSPESRQRHPLQEFESRAKDAVNFFDLASARVKLAAPDRAEVTLHMKADPAVVTITVIRQEGRWYVVYLRGGPDFPYPS